MHRRWIIFILYKALSLPSLHDILFFFLPKFFAVIISIFQVRSGEWHSLLRLLWRVRHQGKKNYSRRNRGGGGLRALKFALTYLSASLEGIDIFRALVNCISAPPGPPQLKSCIRKVGAKHPLKIAVYVKVPEITRWALFDPRHTFLSNSILILISISISIPFFSTVFSWLF